jgi:hypothetical protein
MHPRARTRRHDASDREQRSARDRGSSAAPDQAMAVAGRGAAGGGRSLDAGTRSVMEQRFSHDFAQVRVHADGESAGAARALDAAAYTVGRDIVFGAGLYAPETPLGGEILAHELAHVVQFDRHGAAGAAGDLDGIGREGSAAEREATVAGASVAAGAPAPSLTAPAAAVSRFSLGQLWNTVTDNSLSGAVGYAVEASKDAGSMLHGAAGEASGIPWLGRALGPLGIISNAIGVSDAYDKGGAEGWGDGIASTLGIIGSIAPTLELGAAGAGALGLGSTATAGAAGTGIAGGLGGAAAALGPVAAVAGSAAGGYALGKHLNDNTSVGEHAQGVLGGLDAMLTGEGEQSWMLRQSEEFDESWDKAGVTSLEGLEGIGGVIGNGLQIGGAGLVGAMGGLGGGIADAGSWLADELF